jgi:rSAM/selenodomain-associated transferase 2
VSSNSPWLSIIIPTLNEAASIASLLDVLQSCRHQGVELIVVDGGSTDQTVLLATPRADQCIVTAAGRATQQNAGAALARGDMLWFVHADTGLDGEEWRLLKDCAAGWGRFDVRLRDADWRLAMVAALMNLRSRLTGIATGDQCIFASRALFFSAGGFPRQPLMEDVEISRRLRRIERPLCLRHRITADSRRWHRHGFWATVLLMWWLRGCYFFGVDPDVLHRQYYRRRG